MKIVLTGGGSGGHFYPLIAVARAIKREAEVQHIARVDLFYLSDDAMDSALLLRENIKFIKIPAGKMRRYFSLRYLPDAFKTISGIIIAFWRLYLLMPDVVFSKAGYASFPTLVCARILHVPVLIHESDLAPGVINRWAGKWAKRIAVSFPETARFFKGKNVALVGNPIRRQVVGGNLKEAETIFSLEAGEIGASQVILVLGGSQGAERINETILDMMPEVLEKYQIIHQTGKNNFTDVSGRAGVILEKNPLKGKYHIYAFLTEDELRNAACASSLVISRAGSGSIFEIAAWGLPSIIIPLSTAAQNHQRENAYAYARSGACEVIEETNMTAHILLAEINKILTNTERMNKMKLAAESFARLDAADKIAQEVIKLGIHE